MPNEIDMRLSMIETQMQIASTWVNYWVHFATSESNFRRKVYRDLSGTVELTKEEKEIDAFNTARRHLERMTELEDEKYTLLAKK